MPWKGKPFGWGIPKPYIDYLPEAQDATVNVLRQLVDNLETGGLGSEIKITLNLLEPPSVQLVTSLMFRAYNSDMKVNRVIGGIPKPDPRKSKTKFKLWKYSFRIAKPAVPRPGETLIRTCAELASQPYDYEENWNQAGEHATKFNPDQIHEILAVMVHPPPVQEAIEAWTWLQRVQLAAAQIVAHIELRHGVAVEKSGLTEVILGPIDWTIDAAVTALTQRAARQPESVDSVKAVFRALIDRLPQQGYWSAAEATFQNYLLLPGNSESERLAIEETLALLQSDE